MLIVGVENPAGRNALPGLRLSRRLRQDQSRHADPARIARRLERSGPWVTTSPGCISDEDGQLRAINPEAGYFRRGARHQRKTNQNAYDMIRSDTIFTNVGDRRQRALVGRQEDGTPSTTGRATITMPATALPHIRIHDSRCRPRRTSLFQLAERRRRADFRHRLRRASQRTGAAGLRGKDWAHGVLVGAGVASETTAADTAKLASCAATRWR